MKKYYVSPELEIISIQLTDVLSPSLENSVPEYIEDNTLPVDDIIDP